MDNKKRMAYNYVLYKVLVEIRFFSSISNRIKWWNPFQWRELHKWMKHINRLADAFHNLPNDIFKEGEGFNEESYWKFIKGYEKQYPSMSESYYETFIKKLEEIEKKE